MNLRNVQQSFVSVGNAVQFLFLQICVLVLCQLHSDQDLHVGDVDAVQVFDVSVSIWPVVSSTLFLSQRLQGLQLEVVATWK